MALFGGGNSKTTSQMIRPEYIQQYIDQLNKQIGNTSSGDYVYRDNVGFNNNQKISLFNSSLNILLMDSCRFIFLFSLRN